MTDEERLHELIGLLYPHYFLEKDFNKLKTIFIAGKVYGLQIASKVVDGNFHKGEAKDELIELLKHTLFCPKTKPFVKINMIQKTLFILSI